MASIHCPAGEWREKYTTLPHAPGGWWELTERIQQEEKEKNCSPFLYTRSHPPPPISPLAVAASCNPGVQLFSLKQPQLFHTNGNKYTQSQTHTLVRHSTKAVHVQVKGDLLYFFTVVFFSSVFQRFMCALKILKVRSKSVSATDSLHYSNPAAKCGTWESDVAQLLSCC